MKKLIGLIVVLAAVFMAATTITSTRLVSQLTVSEELETPSISQVITHSKLNEAVSFRPTTDTVTTDVDNVFSGIYSATSGTIDLTSLTNSIGESLDLTGERIMAIKVKAKNNNSGSITIENGATNAYPLFGTTYSFDLEKNQSVLYKADTALSNVSASAKDIDFSMTTATDTLSVLLISAELY